MKSWQLGIPQSLSYKIFDSLRNIVNQSLANYLYNFLSHKKGVKIIEAGSGPGYCASLLNKKKNIIKTIILDIDTEVLKLAKKRDSSLVTKKGSLLKIHYPNNYFDLVYNSSTLEHINNFNQAFSEMVRICKPGGYIFVGLPYSNGPLGLAKIFPENSNIRLWIGKFLGRKEIQSWLMHYPVKLKSTTYYFFYCFQGFMLQKTV